jgi:ATP-dependent RNA helicase SUPV3L1/SUV3
MSALSGAQHLAGSGRTSFPVDKALDRNAYRVLGYRQCGERAVRVDILERLADLIRPALSWRETSPGTKPAGAFDGRGFVVTQAMTSLTGSAGEDFASILRALGYRMEKRAPLPPKPAVVEAAAELASPGAAASENADADADAVAPETGVVVDARDLAEISSDTPDIGDAQIDEQIAASFAALLPEAAAVAEPAEPEPAAVEAHPAEVLAAEVLAAEVVPEPAAAAETPSTDATVEAPAETAAAEAPAEPVATGEAAPAEADAVAAAPETVVAPELIEVWRPGGRSEERRPRHDRSHRRHQDRLAEGAAPAVAAGEGGEAAKGERLRRGRRDRNNDFRKPSPDAPVEAAAAAPAEGAPVVGEPREDKGHPPRERFGGRDKDGRDKGREGDRPKGKFGGGRDKGGRDNGSRDKGGRDREKGGRDSGPSHRQYATSAAPRERERPVDPNSPFAKLAALREQLAAKK